MFKRFFLVIGLLLTGNLAFAEYGLNFPQPVTSVGQDIYDVHMFTGLIVTGIMLVILILLVYILLTFRKSKGYEPDQKFHKTWFGHWSWVLVPLMVLGIDLSIAGKAQRTLDRFWNAPKQQCDQAGADEKFCFDMNVKIIGHQWWWEYEFPEHGIEFNGKFHPVRIESRATPADVAGDNYLRDVDNPLYLPVDTTIRYLNTSVDVLHAWWVPELGFKRDAIPGYITETWAKIDKEGTYRGQCAELCGTWHAKMPVVIKAVSKDKFNTWIKEKKSVMLASLKEANSNKEWSKEELISKGKTVYNTQCTACHQANGKGLPPAFPSLVGSQIIKGSVTDHINMVLNGKGTMPPWKHLSDLDIAAVITYERDAWGNNTGDIVKPADIKAAR